MKKIFGVILFFSFPLHVFSCPEKLKTTLENGKKVTYCQTGSLMVSQDCFNNKENCSLIKKIKENKSSIENALENGSQQNPGSWACDQLGLKVMMGKMPDGSDLCTCQNNSGESVICTSLTY
jgi:hypothetical protein